MPTAFLGPRGTFSEEAAIGFAGPDADLLAFASFPALTSAVETGLATEAILPIENSIEGPVHTTLDLLIHETPLRIAGEVALPVRHYLITPTGATLAELATITSHPQALGQCRRFLERCLPDASQVAALSTAGAVKDTVATGDLTRAAIGTLRSAKLFGGEVLAHDIQDARANLTRFVVLAKQDHPPTGDDKTSLGFTVKQNVPGALHGALAVFAEAGIQLTKMESRPTKAWLGDYVFLVDLEGHRLDEPVATALRRLEEWSASVKIFGSYPCFPLETLRDQLLDPAPLAPE